MAKRRCVAAPVCRPVLTRTARPAKHSFFAFNAADCRVKIIVFIRQTCKTRAQQELVIFSMKS